MSYVLLARECLSYLQRCAMHSNELQTKYRKYRERGVTCGNATPGCREGDERASERTNGRNKNKCQGYDGRDGKKNGRYERRDGGARGCKGEEGDNKKRKIGRVIKAKMVGIVRRRLVQGRAARAKIKMNERDRGIR